MFSFFERKPAAEPSKIVAHDMSEPIPAAIAVMAAIIERKLDKSCDWARKARASLKHGDLQQHMGFLALAKAEADEAAALIESADLLHEEILNQAG